MKILRRLLMLPLLPLSFVIGGIWMIASVPVSAVIWVITGSKPDDVDDLWMKGIEYCFEIISKIDPDEY